MTDSEILRKALDRYRSATHKPTEFRDDVIVFLEKEIDRYRDIIQHMEYNVEKQHAELTHLRNFRNCVNSHYGFSPLEAVQENTASDIIGALSDNGYNSISLSINKFDQEEKTMEERKIAKAEFEAAEKKVMEDLIKDPNIEGMAKVLIPMTGRIFSDEMKKILFPEETEQQATAPEHCEQEG